jgi:hypothetical protein
MRGKSDAHRYSTGVHLVAMTLTTIPVVTSRRRAMEGPFRFQSGTALINFVDEYF